MKLGIIKDLPIKARVARQDSKSSIVGYLDAIVELVTNSDDSYRRLEQKGEKGSGIIEIDILRKKGGLCEEIYVRDYAEGINSERMQKVYPYGEKSSEIENYSVRGFFGRGLKQAILAFGEGEIHSFCNGRYSGLKIWWNEDESKAEFAEIESLSEEEKVRLKLGDAPNETLIVIKNKFNDEDYKSPQFITLKNQLITHFALREIFSSRERVVNLIVKDWNMTSSEPNIKFIFPSPYKELLNTTKIMPSFHDKLAIKICESQDPLTSGKPCGLSGLMIKLKGANIDQSLFSYEHEEAALYFFGVVECPGLFEKIKNDNKNLIEPNRSGLNWRHPYCIEIKKCCDEILKPFILKKKSELTSDKSVTISKNKKQLLNNLAKLLNDIAREELEDLGEKFRPSELDNLIIVPDYAYIEPGQWRTFSIYCPEELIRDAGINKVTIESNNYLIYPSENFLELIPHPRYKDERIYFNTFQIKGDKLGEMAKITCHLKSNENSATIKIRKPGIKGPRPKKNLRGGLLKDIVPDITKNPSMRAKYDEGVMSIYINFPGTNNYLGPELKELANIESQLLLAEIVGETFFRTLVTRKIQQKKVAIIPGKELEAFNREYYSMQKKYLMPIQQSILEFVKR